MLQRLKEWMLPIAMITGALFYNIFIYLAFLTPYLIFCMLLVTYCRVSFRNLRISKLHVWLVAVQIAGSLVVYGILRFIDPLIAEGAFICVLAPTATAAVVVTGMLGGNIASLATFSLISNIGVALVSPILFSLLGSHSNMPFLESFFLILSKVVPLLIFPFITAILLQKILPKVHRTLQNMQNLSFYMWAVALVIVIARTVDSLVNQDSSLYKEELLIGFFSLLVCIGQFILGRFIGKRYHDTIAGGQGLGQKNTVLAIWMAQTYMNPLSSIGPAAYIIWQNSINSYQLWKVKNKNNTT